MPCALYDLQDGGCTLRSKTGYVKQVSSTSLVFSISLPFLLTTRDCGQNMKLTTYWSPTTLISSRSAVLSSMTLPGLRRQTTARWLQIFQFRGSPGLTDLDGNAVSGGKKWLISIALTDGRYPYTRKGCLDAGGLCLLCRNSRSNNFMTVCSASTQTRSKLQSTSALTLVESKGTGLHKHTPSGAGLGPFSP